MNKLILIIHSSDIIRKGLAAILRSFFNVEIIQLAKVEELISYRDIKEYLLICILDSPDHSKIEAIQFLQKKNQLKLIGFFEDNPKKQSGSLFCDYSIGPKISALELQEIFSNCWKMKEKQFRSQENDELTNREKDVLKLVAMGNSNKVIAEKLFISIHTVISHRKNITEKTGIKSISGLTVYAILNNLIDTDTINPEDLI